MNIEKVFARLKGFPRPSHARDDERFGVLLGEFYRILGEFDDIVLHEVNERFLDIYTKKAMPAPIEVERLCHQVKRERDTRINAQMAARKIEQRESAHRFNDWFARNNLHVHGAKAVAEGWQADYYGFLARNERQPTEDEITRLRADQQARVQKWRDENNAVALKAHEAKDAVLATTIRETINQQETIS